MNNAATDNQRMPWYIAENTRNPKSGAASAKAFPTRILPMPLKVIDQVPYSEQQDLVVKTEISPQPTSTDEDGQRGLLTWESELAAGAKQEISLGYTLSWPDGMVLR